VQRSFTVHGDADFAELRRRELVDSWGVTRVALPSEGARLTVGELLDRYRRAPHLWKPATAVSHASVLQSLIADPIAGRRLLTLGAGDARAAISRWQEAGVSVATVSGRWLVLRSAMSWAVVEGLLRSNPFAGMRGPARPAPRRHHSLEEVRRLLREAEEEIGRAAAALSADPPRRHDDATSSAPSRDRCSCGSPPTRRRGVASWRCCASATSTGAC
jgi:hypothetical protein